MADSSKRLSPPSQCECCSAELAALRAEGTQLKIQMQMFDDQLTQLSDIAMDVSFALEQLGAKAEKPRVEEEPKAKEEAK